MGNTSSQGTKTSVYKSEIKSEIKSENSLENVTKNVPESGMVRYGYYKNKKDVFYDGEPLHFSKQELNTFKKLKYSYAKTCNGVYYKGNIINGANQKTFITINRKNMPDELKHFNSVIGMDFENKLNSKITKRVYQFGIKIFETVV